MANKNEFRAFVQRNADTLELDENVYIERLRSAGVFRNVEDEVRERVGFRHFTRLIKEGVFDKPRPPRARERKPSIAPGSPADGPFTASEAAAKLRCSIKTLNGHVASGALGYVTMGHGTKRPRKMFTPADLNAFIANQTRKESPPCPSSAPRARRSGTSTSSSEVIAFTARPRSRPSAKPTK